MPATPTTIGAMGGASYLNGYKGYLPLTCGPDLSDTTTAAYVAVSVVSSFFRREEDGLGRLIEINQQEAIISHARSAFGAWYFKPAKNVRAGNGSPTLASIAPMDMFPARGYPDEENFVMLGCKDEDMFRKLADAIGKPEMKDDPKFSTWQARQENIAELTEILTEYTLKHTKWELMEYLLKEKRIICSAVQSMDDIIQTEELREAGMLQKLEDEQIGEMWVPGWPAISNQRNVELKHPGCQGEANETVYIELLGLEREQLEQLTAEHII